MEPNCCELHLVVDSITEGQALLVLYENDTVTFQLPCSVLPAEISEGDHLRVTMTRDLEARQKEAQRAQDLLKELTAGQDPGQTDFQL